MDDQLIKDIITAVSAVLAIISYFLKRKSDQQNSILIKRNITLEDEVDSTKREINRVKDVNKKMSAYIDAQETKNPQ
jgi:hypothetical protein